MAFVTLGTALPNELTTPPSPPQWSRPPPRRATDGNASSPPLPPWEVPTPPSDAAPGCAAALRTLQMRSTHLVGVALQQGHGRRKSKHVASHRPWTSTRGRSGQLDMEGTWRGSHQAPARRTWLAPKARQALKHTPPCPPHPLPRPSISIHHCLCRRCRRRSFQEHAWDGRIEKRRHDQSRRPTTPLCDEGRWQRQGPAPLESAGRVIAIQKTSETLTCSAAAAQHAICGRPMWPSNLV
jgi:hypothetical protein